MNKYDESDIQVLKGLDAVKKRPGMYIGNTEDGSGLHQLVFEVIDNSLDEHIGGYCTQIDVTLDNNTLTVADNGRGIPISIHREEGVPAAEVVLTTLHAGGKFDNESYAISGGLHGVGLSCVNALSATLDVEIKRDNKLYKQHFVEGYAREAVITDYVSTETGTTIRFTPSDNYFTPSTLDAVVVKNKLQEIAYLNPKLVITFTHAGITKTFQESAGLKALVAEKIKENDTCIAHLNFNTDSPTLRAAISLHWGRLSSNIHLCYTNNIYQEDGGTHLVGARQGIYKAVKDYVAQIARWNKWQNLLKPDDTRATLTLALSIYIPDPRFSSQTKDKLINTPVRSLVDNFVKEHLFTFLIENKIVAEELMESIVLSYKSRRAGEQARDIAKDLGSTVGSTTLPGKLAPCQTNNPDEAEIFLVEGDSAGGSAKQARQRYNQAILPLRGKILNVQKSSAEHVKSSDQVLNVFSALRVKNILEPDMNSIPYHKIIIMADGDIDGRHVRCLLLTLFYKYLRQVIHNGWLFIAQPPLYSITRGRGKEEYLLGEEELTNTLISIGCTKIANREKIESMVAAYINYSTSRSLFSFIPEKVVTNIRKGLTDIKQLYDVHLHKYAEYHMEGNDMVWTEGTKEITIRQDSEIWRRYCRHMQEFQPYRHMLNRSMKLMVNDQHIDAKGLAQLKQVLINIGSKAVNIKRYKGLGEMNPDQLAHTTMEQETRHLTQVTIEDAEEASMVFEHLMGKDVAPRKQFIVDNSNTFRLSDFE